MSTDTQAHLAAIRAANAQKQAAITPVVTTDGDNAATSLSPQVVPVASPTITLASPSLAPARGAAEPDPSRMPAQLGPILLP